MAPERLDRAVERARLMVGDERERRPPALALPVEACVRRYRDEAGVRLGVVADVARDHREPVHRGRALAGDRRFRGIAVLGDLVRGVRGRRRRDRGRPRHGGEKAAALVERGGVGAHDRDLLERDERRADETVPNRKDRLAGDRERRVVEQVVGLVHRP